MAIIKELGLEVNILVGGEVAKEYPDAERDHSSTKVGRGTKVCRCYIESQAGAEFVIQAEVHTGIHGAARWVKGRTHMLQSEPSFDGGPYQQGMSVGMAGQKIYDQGILDYVDNTIQKFRFANVSTVECEDPQRVAKDKEIAKHLGTLCVGFFRVGRVRRLLKDNQYEYNASGLGADNFELAEVALKEDLQKVGIIPRPRTPSPEPILDEGLPEAAIVPSARATTPATEVHGVERLSREELFRMAEERIKVLTLEEVMRLFGNGLKGIPFGDIQRLAGERLEDLPFREVLRLAGEKFKELKNHDKRGVDVKGESEQRIRPRHPTGEPASIKHEGEKVLSSGRPPKHRRNGGHREAIDLTGDD